MAGDVGTRAPDFTLKNQDWQPVTLSKEIEKAPVVLAFFPAAFSSVCRNEMCTLRDSFSQMNNLPVAILGVSVDTPFALKAWADAEKLTVPLLSDFNKEVIRQYDVVNPDMIGLRNIAKRAVIVIDRTGVIRYREALDDARNEPDYQRLKQAVAGLGGA